MAGKQSTPNACALPRFQDANGATFRPVVRKGALLPGYWVSDDGRVFSQWRSVWVGRIRWENSDTAYPLSPSPVGKGRRYLAVYLRFNGRTLRLAVHWLVAEAFFGPYPAGQEVCHRDGNGHNNRLSNLRYGTRASNLEDKYRHGTDQCGERNPVAKLTNEQAEEIRRLRSQGVRLSLIAEQFGVRESTVSRIANGVRRKQ